VVGNVADRLDQLVGHGDAILEQIAPARGSITEQGQRPSWLNVLRQNQDADVWLAEPKCCREPNAFVGTGGRHPDVRHQQVGPGVVNLLKSSVVIVCRSYNLNVSNVSQQPLHAIADEERVICDHHSHGHDSSKGSP
jgi:hypothetical protein